MQTHIPTGDAALALGAVAEQQQAQMIVVGNRGMTGILNVAKERDAAIIVIASKGMHAEDREWFGNVADKVSDDGRVSVLIVSAGAAGAMAGTGAVVSGEVHEAS